LKNATVRLQLIPKKKTIMLKYTFTAIVASIAISSCANKTETTATTDNQTATNPIDEEVVGTAQFYGGNVGKKFTMFQLTWQENGNVVGFYYHPPYNASTLYELKGKNTGSGELILTEYTSGNQSAILILKKSMKNELIEWTGTMHNTDGQKFPVNFTRRP
jgi:hypothetical protein